MVPYCMSGRPVLPAVCHQVGCVESVFVGETTNNILQRSTTREACHRGRWLRRLLHILLVWVLLTVCDSSIYSTRVLANITSSIQEEKESIVRTTGMDPKTKVAYQPLDQGMHYPA